MKNQVVFISMMVVFMLYVCQTQAIATSIDFYSDGIIQEPNIYENVGIWNEAVVDMTGGTVTNDLGTSDQSIFNLKDGAIGGLYAHDSSTVNLFGGAVSSLFIEHNSIVNIYGGDISELASIGNSLVYLYGYNVVHNPTGGYWEEGQVEGNYYSDNSFFIFDLAGQETFSHIEIVPEPATVLLLGLGGVILLRRRKA